MGAVGPAALRRSGEREMVAVLYQERCRRRIPMTERFNPDKSGANRFERKESERFRSFTYEELIKRDP